MVDVEPRTRKGVVTKQRILDTAAELLERTGYRDLSLRAIAKRLDMNPASLLRYFFSREALFAALLKQRDDRDQALPRASTSLAGSLIAAMERNERRRPEVLLYLALAAEAADGTHPAHQFFAEHFALAVGDVERDLQESQPELPAAQREQLARIVVAIADGLQLQWAHDRTTPMAADLEAAVALLRRALATKR